MRMSRARNSAGFTLIEMLIVLGLIAMVFGLVAPRIIKTQKKAAVRGAEATVLKLAQGVDEYYLDTAEMPDSLQDLVTDSGVEGWGGPYVQPKNLKDPWKQDYMFKIPGEKGDYDIISYGPDKRAGGEGLNADISNWQ